MLIMAILKAGIYAYATQWLQAIFIGQRKISYFAAGTLVDADLVSFVFISTGNNITLPDGYYGLLVLQHLPAATHLLASLPVLLALHRATHWALTKRRSAYLTLIVFRVLYSLLAMPTLWSLSDSEASLLGMATALTRGVLTYYALKSVPQAIFTPYSKITDKVDLNSYQNLLTTPWFYTLPRLGILLCITRHLWQYWVKHSFL